PRRPAGRDMPRGRGGRSCGCRGRRASPGGGGVGRGGVGRDHTEPSRKERVMPPVVNVSAQITCCHAGPVVLFPKQTKVMVGGSPALCAGDISGNPTTCPVPPTPASKPCTT